MKKVKIKHLIYLVILFSFILIPSGVFADFGDTTLEKGMTHPDVMELQKKLNELGFFTGEDYTKYFGEKTEAAVIKFQQSTGLVSDGKAGSKTLAAIDIKIRQKKLMPDNFTQLQLGDQGDLVKTIQEKLQLLKLYTDELNSIFDEATQEAVVAFQSDNDLEATGIVDKATFIKINTASPAPTTNRGVARPELGNDIVTYAKEFNGAPYKWGASNGKSFDCSGFTMYVYKKFDIILGHSAASQFSEGTKVSKENLQLGDAVFFSTYKKGASHVGIYVGGGKFIHANSSGGSVRISSLGEAYYVKRYIGARRYL